MNYVQLMEEMANIDKDPRNEIALKRQEALLATFLVHYEKMEKGEARSAARDVFETGIQGGERIYRESLLEELQEGKERENIMIMGNCVRILYEKGLEQDIGILKGYLEWLIENKRSFRACSLAKWLYREDDPDAGKRAYLKEVIQAHAGS